MRFSILPYPPLLTCACTHLEVQLLFSESKILCRDEASQENIDTLPYRERHRHYAIS